MCLRRETRNNNDIDVLSTRQHDHVMHSAAKQNKRTIQTMCVHSTCVAPHILFSSLSPFCFSLCLCWLFFFQVIRLIEKLACVSVTHLGAALRDWRQSLSALF